MCVIKLVKAIRREVRIAVIKGDPNYTASQKSALIAFERADWKGVWTFLKR